MATIYAVYDSHGLVARCDARCHEATGPECHCICGGAHHGVGSNITQEEIRAVSGEELIENAVKLGVIGPLRIVRLSSQLELFAGKGA